MFLEKWLKIPVNKHNTHCSKSQWSGAELWPAAWEDQSALKDVILTQLLADAGSFLLLLPKAGLQLHESSPAGATHISPGYGISESKIPRSWGTKGSGNLFQNLFHSACSEEVWFWFCHTGVSRSGQIHPLDQPDFLSFRLLLMPENILQFCS